MYVEQHTVALPYARDQRFAGIEDLVTALEAKWVKPRKTKTK